MRVKCIDNWFYEHLIKVGVIYEVLEYSYGYAIKPGIIIDKNKFVVIEEDKMEEIKIVRKLEDLDGLENGFGLHLGYDSFNKTTQVYTEDELKFSTKDLEFIKGMGFKFEYKPLRTEQEVKKEILNLESLPFTQEKVNYYVDYNNLINKYLVICDSVNGHGLHIYMPEGLAQKYADELNEIINSK
ncbi:MAG: hypothetical protein RSD79_05835 [Cetobacterium sp.]